MQLQWMQEKFDMKSEDGLLDFDGAIFVLRSLGLNPIRTDVKKHYNENNTDVTHSLDFEEFKSMFSSWIKNRHKEVDRLVGALKELFPDNKIPKDDLIKVLVAIGEENFTEAEAEEKVEKIQFGKDGKITFEEFIQYVQNSTNVEVNVAQEIEPETEPSEQDEPNF
ncbi:hypothetical protein ACJMK2_004456 [Sinanodonta woodiana]|uniref:Sulfhydryl light chain n=1 Tax=Sinanodonta woodiana TaxID=1069815 RepID=A0ABD3Y1U7_SINWO